MEALDVGNREQKGRKSVKEAKGKRERQSTEKRSKEKEGDAGEGMSEETLQRS